MILDRLPTSHEPAATDAPDLDFDGYGPFPDAAPPPMHDAEAHSLIRGIVARQAHQAAVKANAAALHKEDEEQIAYLLAVGGERLEEWARANARRGARFARCLEGVAGFRAVPLRLEVANEHAAVLWCRENCPAAVALRLDRAGLKATAEGIVSAVTGEVLPAVPGVELVGGGERFYVKGATRAAAGEDEGDDAD